MYLEYYSLSVHNILNDTLIMKIIFERCLREKSSIEISFLYNDAMFHCSFVLMFITAVTQINIDAIQCNVSRICKICFVQINSYFVQVNIKIFTFFFGLQFYKYVTNITIFLFNVQVHKISSQTRNFDKILYTFSKADRKLKNIYGL